MDLNKILKIVVAAIFVIGAFFLVRIIVAGDEEIKADEALQNGVVGLFITISIIVLVITAAVTLLFSIKNIFSDSAKMKKTLISVVAFLVVVAIGYGLSKGVQVMKDGEELVSESGSRWSEAGLYTFYFLGIAAVAVMLLGGVKKMTK